MALARPSPDKESRRVFNIAHLFVGVTAHIGAGNTKQGPIHYI